ncbi:cytochrome P450 [Gloeothece verrucosa]|uniref:Cytochrome P450 n=1 Tax=Gloeothece verrucosa (strain PCC 7822) TaxID=497965 RepID=E0UA58_GLOV7|nr:cytochrome P450 [Gloeothece verrucosa]ADN16250.1 cytochrome P450 [Gloeothece verrucosa PCC 7822]
MKKALPNLVNRPAWWLLAEWIIDPLNLLQKWAKKYPDLFTISLAGIGDEVIISNPEIIEEIFNKDAKQFHIGRGNQIIAPLVGQNSLLLMDGERHKRERKLLMPSFHGERLQTYAQQICEITEAVASQWQEGKGFIARTAMQKITLEVITQIVFGLREGERYQKIKPLLAAMLNLTDSPLRSSLFFIPFLQKDLGYWSPGGILKRYQLEIRELLQAEIEEKRHQKGEIGKDILSLMIAARDEQGEPMSNLELKDELLTLLFVGHETTATLLAWAFYQIHRLPQVRQKILQELDSLGENPNPMQITQLPYLTAVCQETLRMYPVIPIVFSRITKTAMDIGNYHFEPQTILTPSIYLVHYREDLYPQPQEFKPERFLERQYSPSEYFPFGGGSRRCLGYALALLEMKLVIAKILSGYELALVDNKPVKITRRGLTLAPSGGIPLLLKSKRHPQASSPEKTVTLVP